MSKNVSPAIVTDDMNEALERARHTLREEAKALQNLSENIEAPFTEALNVLNGIKGRIILTGMGKSGHIGAKIAATLASTGSPSFFVHPGEASHGDLGMITSEDAIIALSHSGGTKELGDIIAHAGRYNIPLIAVTGKANSALGKAADIVLLNGVTKEACPMNLAPTTSTTAALALGDALAVGLMKLKGFKSEDFANYHPGGKLGSRLSKVSDLMHTGKAMPLVAENTPMKEAVVVVSKKRLGIVGVVDEAGNLLGAFTDGDLRRQISEKLLSMTIGEVMTKNPQTIEPTALAQRAVHQMNEKGITALFVVEEGKPVGVIHIHDCLQAGVA